MKISKAGIVLFALLCATLSGIAINNTWDDGKPYSNLKVLPKNISTKFLSHIMIDEFDDGLGVSCNFCHASDDHSQKLNYASDAKPEKTIARSMMQMTLLINKKYFQVNNPLIGDSVMVVTCATCHKGQPRPDAAAF